MKKKWIGAIMLSLGVVLVPPCFADGGQHGAHEGELEIPDTAEGIWHAIDEKGEHLAEVIEEGKLSDVHKIAFAIRDLAQALPEVSQELSKAKHKQLEGFVSRIADHAKNLDNYGDNGQQEKTEVEFEQLAKRLGFMRKLYPESMHARGHGEDERANDLGHGEDKHADDGHGHGGH